MQDTAKQYDHVIDSCKDIFLKKSTDYGTSWRVLRTISVVDQLFIKAQRIRTIQQKGTQRIDDNIAAEFQGIINYGVIGLIQLQLPASEKEEIPLDELTILYNKQINIAKKLMLDKNHDYGEAWRDMSRRAL